MLVDEAMLAARIKHPNVVPTLDVVQTDDELFLVMEYSPGVSLSRLRRQLEKAKKPFAPEVAATIVAGALHGLHAAHSALSESGEPLSIVHRDVSPQNIHIGADGVPRVLDFGIAKAAGRAQETAEGKIKGKFAYMAPEHVMGDPLDARADIYAAAIILWELLAGRRAYPQGVSPGELLAQVLNGMPDPPSKFASVPKELDEIVMKALQLAREDRFQTAHEMAMALEGCGLLLASRTAVADFVDKNMGERLKLRGSRIAEIESQTTAEALATMHQLQAESSPDTTGTMESLSGITHATPRSRTRGPLDDLDAISDRPPSSSTPSATLVAGRDPRLTHQDGEAAARTRRNTLLAAVTILGVAGVIVAALLRPLAPQNTHSVDAIVPSVAAEPRPRTAATSAPVPVAIRTSASVAGAASVAPSATAASSAKPAGVPRRRRRVGRIRPRPQPSAVDPVPVPDPSPVTRPPKPIQPQPKGPDCNPPYFVDADGIKQFKPACM